MVMCYENGRLFSSEPFTNKEQAEQQVRRNKQLFVNDKEVKVVMEELKE